MSHPHSKSVHVPIPTPTASPSTGPHELDNEHEHPRAPSPSSTTTSLSLSGHLEAWKLKAPRNEHVEEESDEEKQKYQEILKKYPVPTERLPCLEDSANICSYVTYWWLNHTVNTGYQRPLEDLDMPEVPHSVKAEVLCDQLKKTWEEEKTRPQPSLIRALRRAFGPRFYWGGVVKEIMDGLGFLQPIMLSWLITHISDSQANPQNPPAEWIGYVLAAAMFIVPAIVCLLNNLYFRICQVMGVQLRAALCTMLYQKSLRLSPAARVQMQTGQIVNMMSVDCSRVDQLMVFLHLAWTSIVQVIVSIALLLRAVGPSALVGAAVMVIMMPLNTWTIKTLRKIRRKALAYTDRRIKLVTEILLGIRAIKLYCWESSFLQRLMEIRRMEMKFMKQSAYMRAVNMATMQLGPIWMTVLTFIVLGASGGDLSPANVFSALVLFNLLRMPLIMLPNVVGSIADAQVAIGRLQKFFLAEELENPPQIVQTDDFAIQIENATFSWDAPPADNNMPSSSSSRGSSTRGRGGGGGRGGMGMVRTHGGGSGRTSGDVTPLTSPSKWYQRSKKDALIDNKKEDEKKIIIPPAVKDIDMIIKKGALVGIVGAVGAGKSSLLAGLLGEMKRISGNVQIAGTVGYCPQQAWIQNNTVRNNILFGQPFDQQRYEETLRVCALERDIEILPSGDDTEIGERGINLSGGQKQRVSLARAVYFNADIILLDDPLSAVDAHVSKYLFDNCIMEKLKSKTRVLVTHQLQYINQCDYVIFIKDGGISEQGTFLKLMSQGSDFATLMTTHVGSNEKEENKQNEIQNNNSHHQQGEGNVEKKQEKGLMSAEDRTRGSLDKITYKYYLMALGGVLPFGILTIAMIVQQLSRIFTDFWLSVWTDDSVHQTLTFYIVIYTSFGIAQMIFMLLASFYAVHIGTNAGIKLHDLSFASVMRAPMSWFDTTPAGRVINRFSRDQDIIDTLLMNSILMFCNLFFQASGALILIGAITPLFFIAIIPITVFYIYIQAYYRPTTREVKRLDSNSRSPLYAHFSETLTGLPTIRAYRQQPYFIAGNYQRMDNNDRPYFFMSCAQRWLGSRLEFCGALIVFATALVSVVKRYDISPGLVGLTLSYALQVTSTLTFLVRQSIDSENNMNSVERSKHYTLHIPHESATTLPGDRKLASTWPSQGALEFQSLGIRYREGLPLVLKQIRVKIKGGERIGVVGRTGAGKSSLMLALYRMIEPSEGTILIDDVDITTIGLDRLRSNLAIIPQDPILYSGTVRSNLDPFSKHTDAEIWNVLEKSHLRDAILKLDEKLESPVAENGENFSVGQRCQMCLARAMLRSARVLILDEATASVDMETDAWIQTSLREFFTSCTILTIAHRLATVVDYDRIMVLSYGELKEFDTPANLLRDPHSMFSSMVDETGESNAALLRNIAFNAEKNGWQSNIPTNITTPSTPTPPITTTTERADSISHVQWHES